MELIEVGRPAEARLDERVGVEVDEVDQVDEVDEVDEANFTERDDRVVLTPPAPRRWGWSSAMVGVAYLALGVIAYWRSIPDLNGRVTGQYADFIQSVWFIGWVPHAIDHGLNPFFSGAMYAPTGFNLADNTASPFLGLLGYPISRLFSPLASANVLMVLAMPLSALAAFAVLRKWNVWGPAAAIAGAMYGFSPYMVAQGLNHVELLFIPVPPLIALTIEEILHRRGDPRRLGLQLGVLISVQFLISPEVMAVVTVLAVVALLCIAVRNGWAWRTKAQGLLRPTLIALGVAALLLAYPVWMLVAGPQHLPGPTQPVANGFHNDLLSFVIPGSGQRVSFGLPSQWGGQLVFDTTEDGGYIGIPLLVLAGAFAWRSRRRARMQLTVVLLAVSGVLSLGPSLSVAGHATGVPLPFALIAHFPLLNDILPSRISFATSGLVAAVIAFGLDDWHLNPRGAGYAGVRSGHSRNRTTAPLVLAGVTLIALVVSQFPSWPYTSSSISASPASTFSLPHNVERAIPKGDPVTITYPYTATPVLQSLLWQSASDYKFRIVGGYARRADSAGRQVLQGKGGLTLAPMDPPELQRFIAILSYRGLSGTQPTAPESVISSRLLTSTRTTLSRNGVQVVMVDRKWGGSHPVMQLFNEVLGPPDRTVGSYSFWLHVPQALQQDTPTQLSLLNQSPSSRH